MDQLMYASLSHTHFWYEVGIMLKVLAMYDGSGHVLYRGGNTRYIVEKKPTLALYLVPRFLTPLHHHHVVV